MWDLVKRLVDSVLGPIWGRILKLPWLARLNILIVILTVSGLFYYPAQVSYTFTRIEVPFPDAFGTVVMGINARGQIVGYYVDSSQKEHSFLKDKGVFTPIDVPFPGAHTTQAVGINARGQIVGYYVDSSGTHGFLEDKGVFTPIDVPFPGAVGTAARGINDHGQIVGYYVDSSQKGHSFLEDKGVFTMLDVPRLDPHLAEAFGINDYGQIVGSYFSGMVHSFLATPTRGGGSGLPSSPCCSWPQAACWSSRACA